MTAQPLEIGPTPTPRNYNAISAALPEAMVGDFTEEYHAADMFRVAGLLEFWGRMADQLADPATYAALDRCQSTPEGLSLYQALAAADR